MAVERLIILPLVGQFFCYSLMTLILPAILFRHKLDRFILPVRFMIYQLIGNFYLMNLVFLLQLLHICNPFTLWGVTIVLFVWLMLKKKKKKFLDVLDDFMEYMRRYLSGLIGRRSVWSKIGDFWVSWFKDCVRWLKRYFLPHILEWVVLAAVLVYFFYIRGTTYFVNYGYYYSDMMVHNYWINGLSDGKLFVAGIYPYGYHCIMYSMHAMFGIPSVYLLRLFGLVQFTFLILEVYAFLRSVGKSWFAPFIGILMLCGWDMWRSEVLDRFASPLPQEFGYLFMLPAFYFAILFFRDRAAELKAAKEKREQEGPEGEEGKKRKRKSLLRPVHRKKTDGLPVMRPPKGPLPEKVYIGTGHLFFYCSRDEFSGFLNKEPGEIYPVEAYQEDGTLKSEYVPELPEEEYPVQYALQKAEEEELSRPRIPEAAEDYPLQYAATEAETDYPVQYAAAEAEDDYPVQYAAAEAEDDYPVQYAAAEAEDDYPVQYAAAEAEDDYPVQYAAAEVEDDYPVHYAAAEAEPNDPKTSGEDGEMPIFYEEDEDGYRYYYDENGDYPVVFEEEEEIPTPEDWDSIIREALKPKQRKLTEDEKRRYERRKRWRESRLYKLYQKTKPFRMKVKKWLDARKLHPIRRFVAWCRSMPPSTQDLLFFAFAFSMTLSCHFYVTIAAGLGCIALALTWFLKFFRWKYLKSVLLAILASILFAIYPMGIAYVGGTPLQGSIGWAMNVMKGEDEKEDGKPKLGTVEIDGVTYAFSLADGMTEEDAIRWIRATISGEDLSGNEDMEDVFWEDEEEEPKTLQEKLAAHEQSLEEVLTESVFITDGSFLGFSYIEVVYALLGAGLLIGIVVLFKDREFGKTTIAMALSAGFLLLVFILKELGLPQLMDANRDREFFAFALSVSFGVTADAAVFLVLGWKKLKYVMHGASLALFAGAVYLLYHEGALKLTPVVVDSLQTNGAMVSTLTILDEYPRYHWTVVTANDELHMVEEYGRHTEVISFLRSMENYDANSSEMFIPTDYVFFYVEKQPIDVADYAYEGDGQFISEKGAQRSLPKGNRIAEVYYGEPRWITMSHMYYWAQKFMELFPNEMEVLYEDDTFICYKIQQNTYSLYNFAINYGYNAKSSSDHRRRRSEG